MNEPLGLAGRLAAAFLNSRLTPLISLASLALGLLAIAVTPREEEPQIVVPMIDIAIGYPGALPAQVETELVTPLERALWSIEGVEYIYSTAQAHRALITVRFEVGRSQEQSLVRVQHELSNIAAALPAGASLPTARLLTIDDVPFLTLTLHSASVTSSVLRAVADELGRELSRLPDTARVQIAGGAPRQIRIEPIPERLQALGLSVVEVAEAVGSNQSSVPFGALVRANRRQPLTADANYQSARDLESIIVATGADRPIYLKDVADVIDAHDPEPAIVLHGSRQQPGMQLAVSIAIAKRKGANATVLAERILERVERAGGTLVPNEISWTVTRNYGKTAKDKSNELIEHLLIATLSVTALIGLAMGWRSAVVVGLAVPVTLALTLAITYLFGYTLNRVTLFALIFSIGILVDDAIVVVENIDRHLHLPGRTRSIRDAIVAAVHEVGNPTILATFAVIAAILPMAFVSGLMGPYMRPIPVGASLAMLFSLAIAFVISPWVALRLFGSKSAPASHEREGRTTKLYRWTMHTLLTSSAARAVFFAVIVVLLLGAVGLVGVGLVKVKMLPFDNKSEFQVQIDRPDGIAQHDALALAQRVAQRLIEEPTVENLQIYSGTAAPFPFVGLVRHSFLRERPEQVSIQVNLVDKQQRDEQSHQIITRLRTALEPLIPRDGTRLKLLEIPPGPPVLDTLVAEVYGPTDRDRREYAQLVRHAMESTEGVVDIDSSLNPSAIERRYLVDRDRARRKGVDPVMIVQTLELLGAGTGVENLAVSRGVGVVPIVMQLSPEALTDDRALLEALVPGRAGRVPVRELVRIEQRPVGEPIHHKNLLPLTYVFADVAGQIESPVYALNKLNRALDDQAQRAGVEVPRYGLKLPTDGESLALKWDGEWHITLEVFRDLGVAFAIVMLLIFVLVVGWFQSFSTPWVILVPVPLSLIGILPAHALAGAFFTATSMIGFIAGAGIIVRNSIILVDFIEIKRSQGMELAAAVEEAGAVRFRPMLLTASAVLVGSAVMLADPIFQGLAISLMAGEVAATLLSRLTVPVLYFLLNRVGSRSRASR